MQWNWLAKPKKCRMSDIQGEVDTVRTWVISPVLHVYFSEINQTRPQRRYRWFNLLIRTPKFRYWHIDRYLWTQCLCWQSAFLWQSKGIWTEIHLPQILTTMEYDSRCVLCVRFSSAWLFLEKRDQQLLLAWWKRSRAWGCSTPADGKLQHVYLSFHFYNSFSMPTIILPHSV